MAPGAGSRSTSSSALVLGRPGARAVARGKPSPTLGPHPVGDLAPRRPVSHSISLDRRCGAATGSACRCGRCRMLRRRGPSTWRSTPIGLALDAARTPPLCVPDGVPLMGLLAISPRAAGADRSRARAFPRLRGTALLLGDMVEADDAYTAFTARMSSSLVAGRLGSLDLDRAIACTPSSRRFSTTSARSGSRTSS